MPKVFHDPHRNPLLAPPSPPPTYLIYGPLSARKKQLHSFHFP